MKYLILFLFLASCTAADKTVVTQARNGDFEYTTIDMNAVKYFDKKLNVVCYHIGDGTGCVKLGDE